MSCVVSVGGICSPDDGLRSVRPRTYRHHQMPNRLDMGNSFLYLKFLIFSNAAAPIMNLYGDYVKRLTGEKWYSKNTLLFGQPISYFKYRCSFPHLKGVIMYLVPSGLMYMAFR